MLLRGSEATQQRILTIVGSLIVLCSVLAGYLVIARPFGGRPAGEISVAIDTPYVGEGVRKGTAIVMHGVGIGIVTSVSDLPGGGSRLLADFQKTPAVGLTDSMKIDFQPINYFGVTGINVLPADGGQQLRDGMRITTLPQANSTLEALLNRLGQVSVAALTPKLISAIERSVQYTDGLTPLVETMLITMHAVAAVQTVPTARLLANATGLGVAFPGFTDASIGALHGFIDIPRTYSDDEWRNGPDESLHAGATEIFGGAGRIESNYVDSLLPLIDGVKALLDPVPALFRPDDFASTLVQLRTRLEKLFAGNGEERAVQIKIVLDSLPGVAAPIAAMGGPR